MKKVFLLIVLLLSGLKVVAPDLSSVYIPSLPPEEPFNRLIHAIGMVEAKGDTLAYNGIEQAVGFFQIRPIRVKDYNRRTGSRYTLKDMFDYEISEKVFLYYASRVGPYNFEKIARNWNGSGVKTLDYWKRVKKHL